MAKKRVFTSMLDGMDIDELSFLRDNLYMALEAIEEALAEHDAHEPAWVAGLRATTLLAGMILTEKDPAPEAILEI